MREVKAIIGGEGNGGVIDPRVGYVRDPFIGMAMVLHLMAETHRKLSELVAELPAYAHHQGQVHGRPRPPAGAVRRRWRSKWPEAKANRDDGLRLDWADRWVHVRPSNTEPIVRVIAEAPQAAAADGLCREVGGLLSA